MASETYFGGIQYRPIEASLTKIYPLMAEELVAEPLFYNDNIKVGNKTIFHKRWSEKGVYCISHLLHFLDFEKFQTKYGLNVDFLSYNSCVQAVKKYIWSLDIDVQSNKSSILRKSLTINYNVQRYETF